MAYRRSSVERGSLSPKEVETANQSKRGFLPIPPRIDYNDEIFQGVVILRINRTALSTIFTPTLGILFATARHAQSSGVFPPEPFNGLQVSYKISGATATKFEDVPGFTWTRSLTFSGFAGPGELSVGGTLTAGGYYADVVVRVTAGGKTESKTYKVDPKSPQSFLVSVAIPKNATYGGISIVMTGHYNAGTRGVVVTGSWDQKGVTNKPADPNKNRGPQSPVARVKEIIGLWTGTVKEGIAATGDHNNNLSLLGDPKYDKFKCGEYQSRCLDFLQSLKYSDDPKKRALIEGIEFGPIQAQGMLHQAVVIYRHGTKWEEDGIILDPWPTQKHEGRPITYTMEEWTKLFNSAFVGKSSISEYKGQYFSGTYPDPHLKVPYTPEVLNWFKTAPPHVQTQIKKLNAIPNEVERQHAIRDLYKSTSAEARTIVKCPLNAYLVDGKGRVSGFPGGVARTDIPGVRFCMLRLADGTFWTELDYPRDTTFKLILEGTGTGPATVYTGFNMTAQPRDRRIQQYNFQVSKGQKFTQDQQVEGAPLRTLAQGTDSSSKKEQILFTNWNKGGVLSSPLSPTVFEVPYLLRLTYLNTYHYHFGRGAKAGTIALRHTDGTLYGPWQAKGVLSSGAPDGTWEVRPDVVLKPGTYTIVDSSPETWSQNSASSGKGFAEVRGYREQDKN